MLCSRLQRSGGRAMSAIRGIHHVNFVFRDLDAAVRHFESALGLGPFRVEELDERGAITARALVGETWLVLVSPTREDSVAGRFLEEHGEGFFLLSFGVADIDRTIATMKKRLNGSDVGDVRTGAGKWRIADLPVDQTLGIRMQLTEDPEAAGD